MEPKTLGRLSAKQTLLTKRVDLTYSLSKKESEKKPMVQGNTENGKKQVWNEARSKPRRTSAPAELPPIKDALPKLTVKTRARTLSLRGENINETHTKQWNSSKTQNKVCDNPSTARATVKAKVNDAQQRPLSALTSSNNSVIPYSLGMNDDNSILNQAGQVVGRKCLTQEALICHELVYTETDEDSASKKKDMIVRWLNSEALSSSDWKGLEQPRAFPQL